MINFRDCRIRFGKNFQLELNWRVEPGQVWAVVGPNGSGKSVLIEALAGEGTLVSGECDLGFHRTAVVSLEAQAALIEREKLRDDSDVTDKVSEGTPVSEMIAEVAQVSSEAWAKSLKIDHLMDRGFRKLSTGETRRLLIVRALASDPDLLLLDEPFEGLDVSVVPVVRDLLQQASQGRAVVLALNRIDEIPDNVTHVLRLESGRIAQILENRDTAETRRLLHQISTIRSSVSDLPPPETPMQAPLNADGSLVNLRAGRVAYGDQVVFEDLDFAITPGQHWQIKGRNGSGKTCLLNLMTGDHPQCYVNDINIFGYRRGSGESIWEVKQYLGFVSTALHWDYRLSVSVRNVVISGFYDSIGMYARATDKEVELADAWLSLLGLSDRATAPFSRLSFGEQRVVLIARAMVKHPALLLLDEPCIGLDEGNRALVLALIERIAEEGGTTLVYVTHHDEDRIHCIQQILNLDAPG